jgi:hypothetical protein
MEPEVVDRDSSGIVRHIFRALFQNDGIRLYGCFKSAQFSEILTSVDAPNFMGRKNGCFYGRMYYFMFF